MLLRTTTCDILAYWAIVVVVGALGAPRHRHAAAAPQPGVDLTHANRSAHAGACRGVARWEGGGIWRHSRAPR
eukprot:scaffold920_cov135-Isochrysis_galbana.AAC.8